MADDDTTLVIAEPGGAGFRRTCFAARQVVENVSSLGPVNRAGGKRDVGRECR